MQSRNSKLAAARVSSQRKVLVVLAAVLQPLLACDLTVTNPGRITEADLTDPTAADVVLNGLIADTEFALKFISLHTGLASDELGFSGTRSWLGFFGAGDIRSSDTNVTWDPAATARWTAETGVERLTELAGAENPFVAEAHVWAGYILRIMGDTFCQAVFDGGPAEPNAAYYERAIGHFEAGHQLAAAAGDDRLRLAAVAGLAQVNLILGNYAEAADFAGSVPDDFLFVAQYSENSGRENNEIWSETHQQSQATVFGTPIVALDPDGDPRTPWEDTGELGAGGQAPFYRQLKYNERGSDIPLAKGWEMRLIEAEALLRAGEVGRAVDQINVVRAEFGVPLSTAATEAEAWAALDHERLVTLWMEGRRLKDNARFFEEGRNDFLEGRDACFVLSDSELNSNPNL